MKNYKELLLLIVIFSSTYAIAYVPPVANVNSFNNPKELHVSFGFGTNGAEQSISFALPKKTFIYFNSSFSIDSMQVHDTYSKHLFLDIAYGFEKNIGTYWRFITSGGYSYGQFGVRSSSDNWYRNSSYYSYDYVKYSNVSFNAHRIFVSGSFGLKLKILEVYLGGRITVGDYISNNLEDNIHLKGKASLEPNVTIKAGFEKVKFTAQIRQSIDTFTETFGSELLFDNSYFSLGIEANINFNENK